MSVKFYLRSKTSEYSSLNIIVIFKKERIKIPSGVVVAVKFWNQNFQRTKEHPAYPDAKFVNETLEKIEKACNEVYNYYVSNFQFPTKNLFQKKVKELLKGEIKENENKLFLDFIKNQIENLKGVRHFSLINDYKLLAGKLEEFENYKKTKLSFEDININFYRDFQKWFYSKNYSVNYFGRMIKNIKMFMNEAIEQEITQSHGHRHKSFIKPTVDSENIYLTVDELLKIYKLNLDCFPAEKRKSYLTVKYKFLVGAFTALRISDFNRLENINIKDGFLKIKTKKTGQNVIVPVHWVVDEILKTGFDLKTKISDQAINRQIKDICKEAGITDNILINESVGGVNVQKIYKKYELVSSHTARRSGATNMFKSGIPTISIMKITGHRTEKAFLKYIKITDQENAEMLSKHEFFNRH